MKATDLLIWGIVVHLLIDWLAQNEWIAANKAKRRQRTGWVETENSLTGETFAQGVQMQSDGPWWDRHPAAYIHAGMHGAAQLLIFPWPAALAIGITHLLIDTRKPVEWWSRLIRQTQPSGRQVETFDGLAEMRNEPLFDIGADVRIWVDQVWHIGVIAILALVAA